MSILRTMCSIRNRTACSGEPDELSIMKISMIWWRDFWKNTGGETEVREEILRLEAVEKRQQAYLKEDVDYMIKSTEKMLLILQEAKRITIEVHGNRSIILGAA